MKFLRIIGGIAVFAALGLGAWMIFRHQGGEDASDEEGEIQTEVAVKTVPLVKTTLRQKVVAYGTAQPEPASVDRPAAVATVVPPSAGLITEVNCVEGQTVKKGDLLISLDTRAELSRLDQAKSALEFATTEYNRQKKLLQIQGTSEKNLQSAQNDKENARLQVAASETTLALLRMEAPISGVVTKVAARKGEMADPAMAAVEILDPDRLALFVRVPAASSVQIEKGQSASFYRDDEELPEQGTVTYVSPLVDTQTGTVDIRVSIPVADKIRDGEWLEARIITLEKPGVLAAPVESITNSEEGGPVVAVVEDDTARQVPVETGIRDEGLVEVEGEGLSAGTQVVTVGAYGLPQETKVRILAP